MQLKQMSKEELEILSYTDLTELVLADTKKPMNTAKIFKKICDLLEYSDDEYAAKIGDYYTSLTTDKRFIFLDSAEWDLSKNHPVKIELDEDDELDEEVIDEELDEEEPEESEESIDDEIIDDDLDTDDDDIDDLAILTEDELEEN